MNQSKINLRNDKKEKHGYWEQYWPKGSLAYKGNFINGNRIGYWEWYNPDRSLYAKKYFIL